MKNEKKQLLEGSHAIALTIKAIGPNVVSAYPITPQTHIVEDLAKFKADNQASYEYVLAESEFAAASIVLGASATGVRTYSATSSQGLLLMTEVLHNISGMRLPVVMTVANRAISAPINIWNDHSDVMAIRDSGCILLFAENHQEAIDQHVLAYKIAESLSLPVLVNVDGFIITHSYESCEIPETKTIKKFLPTYKPNKGEYLDPKNPITMGMFVSPKNYAGFRRDLHEDLLASLNLIDKEYRNWKKIFPTGEKIDNGLIEYYGPKNPKKILVTLGSVAGTIKEVIDRNGKNGKVGLIKVRCYRPFPGEQIKKTIKGAKSVIAIEKAYALGSVPPLYSDLSATLFDQKIRLGSQVVGLGGQDVTETEINKIIKKI